MVVWGFRLIVVLSFLGRHVRAVPRAQGEGGQFGGRHGGQHPSPFQQHTQNTETIIMTTPTAAAAAAAQVTPEVEGAFPSTTPQSSDTLGPQTTDQPTTSVSQTSTAIPSSTPTFPWFESNWNAPASFVENVPQQVYYQINDIPNLDGVNFDPVLFVCQTNASDPTLMDSSNTWSVAQIPSK